MVVIQPLILLAQQAVDEGQEEQVPLLMHLTQPIQVVLEAVVVDPMLQVQQEMFLHLVHPKVITAEMVDLEQIAAEVGVVLNK
jgi:hypothetical protein